jgi:Uma2 family endonuclease
MPKTVTMLGPGDHGRRMSLDEFETAEGQAGYVYELGRGVVTVVDVPKPGHLEQMAAARNQFIAYQLANPRRLHMVAGGADCKILLADLESERHPDVAVYKTPPPSAGDEVWSLWIPEVVIEIVSPGSEQRDYEEKPEEYFRFGVKEFWIIDAQRQEMLVLRRLRGKWSEQTLADQFFPHRRRKLVRRRDGDDAGVLAPSHGVAADLGFLVQPRQFQPLLEGFHRPFEVLFRGRVAGIFRCGGHNQLLDLLAIKSSAPARRLAAGACQTPPVRLHFSHRGKDSQPIPFSQQAPSIMIMGEL